MAPFVVFEGIDGSGKTTQIDILRRKLIANGHNPLVTREPGGTPLGEAAGLWLQSSIATSPPSPSLLLFNAVRAEHVTKVIQPALDAGHIVLCDRFDASTIAYQAYGRGLDAKMVKKINRIATDWLAANPDRLPRSARRSGPSPLSRKRQSIYPLDRSPGRRTSTSSAKREFHQRVRRGYQDMAARNPRTWLTIDGTLPKETVAEKIWARLQPP